MTSKYYRSFFILALFTFGALSQVLHAQSFKGGLIAGFNASQLDGDNLSGFNKLGLQAGMRIWYPMDNKAWSAELILHQKGSSEDLSFGTPDEQLSITLHYLSLPLLFHYYEWFDEVFEDYRIRLDGGVVTNALFTVSSNNPAFDDATDNFKKFDFGLTLGIGYRLGFRWMAVFRYERSLLKIYKDPLSGTEGLQSYLLNFRLEYEF